MAALIGYLNGMQVFGGKNIHQNIPLLPGFKPTDLIMTITIMLNKNNSTGGRSI